jgi:hypothetical protein
MDQMDGIGYRVEDHPRTAEYAGPLTYRPGQTFLVAFDGKGFLTLAVDLFPSFFEYLFRHDCLAGLIAVCNPVRASGMPAMALSKFINYFGGI